MVSGFGKEMEVKARQEAALAWLEEKVRTSEVLTASRPLFLCALEDRKRVAEKGIEKLRKVLRQVREKPVNVVGQATADSVFMTVHHLAIEAKTWLGPSSWTDAIMLQASVPGVPIEVAEEAFLRKLDTQSVSRQEVQEVINAFVAATWGDQSLIDAAHDQGFGALAISTLPHFAAVQYSIGILWGYALRGLVLRLAMDRRFGTVPESPADIRRRLERAMAADSEDSATQEEEFRYVQPPPTQTGHSPSLMDYASSFFSHADWAALCKPSDAAISALESELEDAIPDLAMLTGAEESDDEIDLDSLDSELMADDEDEDGEPSPKDMVTLELQHWQAFQRRAAVLGSLLADAEALVESEMGVLPRGARPASKWVSQIVRAGALSSIRLEQGAMVAKRILEPHRRLAKALKEVLVPSKLKAARKGLELFFKSEPPSTTDEPPPK